MDDEIMQQVLHRLNDIYDQQEKNSSKMDVLLELKAKVLDHEKTLHDLHKRIKILENISA